MDVTIVEWLNALMHAHPLLDRVTAGFAVWGVVAFGAAVAVLWLLEAPESTTRWRLAVATGLAGSGLALLVNQIVSNLWHRARPYEAHGDIVPLVSPSHDPSFPSDHAAAAFGIAVGILLVHRGAGRLFVSWAVLIAASRVLTGMHYPTDVLAGAAIGAGSAVAVAGLAGRPLRGAVRVASRVTDTVLDPARRAPLAIRTVGSPAVRRACVAAAGAAMLAVFAFRLRAHVLDEMPLAVLALWASVILLAMAVAGRSTARAG